MIELDATRLLCPMPVIKLQNAIKQLVPDEMVFLRCTDPGTHYDIPTWCRLYGHTVVRTDTTEDEIHFYIRVA